MQRKSLDMPDETRTISHGRTDIWNLGDVVVGKITFEPGWNGQRTPSRLPRRSGANTTTWA